MKKTLNSNTKGTVRNLQGLLESLVLAILYYFIWRKGYEADLFPNYFGNGKYVLMGVYVLLCIVVFRNTDGFTFGDVRRLEVALAQWIALMIINVITYLQLCLIANVMITPVPVVILTVAEAIAVIPFVYLFHWLNQILYMPHNMLMIVGNREAVTLKLKMDSRRDKYLVKKMISVDVDPEVLKQEILQYESVILNDISARTRNDILKFCYQHDIRVYAVPKLTDILMRGADEVTNFDTPLVVITGGGLTQIQRVLKRTLDIVLCLIAMIVAAPIMLAVALAIKLDDGGPVFYKQKRATVGGKEFDILKFRSMIVNAEKEGHSIPATGEDPRITKVGKIIRACRVDELPQILNILKGDMSIVGPRPERIEHVQAYSEEIPEFGFRLKVKGGLTGYAQIYGKYNTSAYDKLRLDLMYIENYSIFLDIKLIIMTLRILLKKESTEGFDVAAENEKKKEELIKELVKE